MASPILRENGGGSEEIPASNLNGVAAGFEEGGEGNRRGGHGLYSQGIRATKESLICAELGEESGRRRIRFLLCRLRTYDVTDDVTVGPAWQRDRERGHGPRYWAGCWAL